MDAKLANMAKENETLSKQVVDAYSAMENRDEKIKDLMGKIDELEHQLGTYWAETKNMIDVAQLKKQNNTIPTQQTPPDTSDQQTTAKYEDTYKDAFEAFQKGEYEEAIKRFSSFIESYSGAPLISNACYWMGESYLSLNKIPHLFSTVYVSQTLAHASY